eukprot:gene1995-2456_t
MTLKLVLSPTASTSTSPLLTSSNNKNNRISSFFLKRTTNQQQQQRIDFKLLKDKYKHPIFVSQDCDHNETTTLLQSGEFDDEIIVLRNPNRTKVSGYEAISRHYKWALGQVFDKLPFDAVILLEDDLEVSPDFLQYFQHSYQLLKRDKSLFCVSGWNDNGKKELMIEDEWAATSLFYRTDFFPGLGWMMLADFWKEIKKDWPINYWDEFLRKPSITKGRQCIRPEISRIKNIGFFGASDAQFYELHLKDKEKNNRKVDYKFIDFSNLEKDKYNNNMKKLVESAKIIQRYEIDTFGYKNQTLRIIYKDKYDFRHYANAFGLMDDIPIPRTSYKRIVHFYYKTNLILLTPKSIDWEKDIIIDDEEDNIEDLDQNNSGNNNGGNNKAALLNKK